LNWLWGSESCIISLDPTPYIIYDECPPHSKGLRTDHGLSKCFQRYLALTWKSHLGGSLYHWIWFWWASFQVRVKDLWEKITKWLLFYIVTICFIQCHDVDWHEILRQMNFFLSYRRIIGIWRKEIKWNNRSVALSLWVFFRNPDLVWHSSWIGEFWKGDWNFDVSVLKAVNTDCHCELFSRLMKWQIPWHSCVRLMQKRILETWLGTSLPL